METERQRRQGRELLRNLTVMKKVNNELPVGRSGNGFGRYDKDLDLPRRTRW